MKTAQSDTPTFNGKPIDVVVDVRSKLEFWMGHLPGAVCIPVDQLPAGLSELAGISPFTRILVYCASGNRSRTAAAELEAAGFTNVVDGGGIAAARKSFAP